MIVVYEHFHTFLESNTTICHDISATISFTVEHSVTNADTHETIAYYPIIS